MNKQRSNALWQLLVLVALAAAVALTLAWPQLPFARREAEPVEVSVILRSADGSAWANARLGMEQAAGQLRAEVRIVTLTADNDAAEQAGLMQYEAQRGADVLVCGTCLNFYGLTERLKAGTVSNMYDIVERMQQAAKVITV